MKNKVLFLDFKMILNIYLSIKKKSLFLQTLL